MRKENIASLTGGGGGGRGVPDHDSQRKKTPFHISKFYFRGIRYCEQLST